MLAIIMAIEDPVDRSFVETLYNKYSEKMYLRAFEILKDHSDAQDCVHDTIERVIAALGGLKCLSEQEY